jgi:hypothetical protein
MFAVPRDRNVVIRARVVGRHVGARWRRNLWFLPLALVNLARVPLSTVLWTVAGAASLSVVCFGLIAQTKLGIVDGMILRRSWVGRSKSCPRSAIARVVELPIVLTRLGLPETWLVFVDEEDRALLRAYSSFFTPADLERFRSALDLPWDSVGGLVTAGQARTAFPGSFRWPWAHYWLTTVAVLVAGFLVAVTVVAIVTAVR